MSENKNIICPNCGESVDVENVLYHNIKEQFSREYNAKLNIAKKEFEQQKSNLEIQQAKLNKQKETFETQLNTELEKKLKLEGEKLEQIIRGKLKEENEAQFNQLQKELNEKSTQVKELNRAKAEIARLNREKDEIEDQVKARAEQTINATILQEREKIKKQEEERNELKLSERETLIESLKTQLQDAQRKAEQGSMQMQGEVQELAIETWLKEHFPLDTINEVKKGAHGADCLQIVNSRTVQNCGTIYYESKRTKDFQPGWIEKFKNDMRDKNADIGVLVTKTMPKDLQRIGKKNGVWVCSFEEFKGLCFVLRDSLIKLNDVLASQENKGDKMHMLYGYLTSNEFKLQIEGIVEGFTQMQIDLDSEKRSLQGIWKKREKQIQKVLLNTNFMYNSIKGIAGNAIAPVSQLELPTADE